MFVSSYLTPPPPSPSVLLKAPAAVNSMCHRKDRQGETDSMQKNDKEVQVWRMDKPDDRARIVLNVEYDYPKA